MRSLNGKIKFHRSIPVRPGEDSKDWGGGILPSADDSSHYGSELQLREGLVEKLCRYFSEVCLLSIVAITVLELLTRNIFGFSFNIGDEYGGYLLVAVTFTSLSVSHIHNCFHEVNFVTRLLPIRVRTAIRAFYDLLAMGLFAILAWQLTRYELNSWRIHEIAPTVLATPLWIPELVMPLGCMALLFTLGRCLIANLNLLLDRHKSQA